MEKNYVKSVLDKISLKVSDREVMLVYAALNIQTNKVYIGLTTNSLFHRKQSHLCASKKENSYFYNAVRKYGWNCFIWYVLYRDTCKENLCRKEIEFIKLFNSKNKFYGFNTTEGGACPTLAEETKIKLSNKMKGRFIGKLNPFFGKTHKEDLKNKWSSDRKGKKNSSFLKHSQKTKNKLSELRKSRASLPENKEKLKLQNQNRIIVYCLELDIEFASIKDAAKYFNINYLTFKQRLRKYGRSDNYTFILKSSSNILLT